MKSLKKMMIIKILIGCGSIFFLLFIIIGPLLFMVMLPTAEPDFIEEYKRFGDMTGIDWMDMVVYDTVRYMNDFTKVNPEETAYEFLVVDLKHYRLEDV